jgi:hypothetical protein
VLVVPEIENLGMKVVSVNKKNVGMKLKIKRVEGLRDEPKDMSYFVQTLFIHGSEPFMEPQFTKLSQAADGNVIWDQVSFTSVTIPNLPLGIRVQFSMWARIRPQGAAGVSDPTSVDPSTDKCIGWVNFALFNSAGFMKSGMQAAILWVQEPPKPDAHGEMRQELVRPDPVGSCLQNVFAKDPVTLFIDFEPSMYFKNPRMRPRMKEAPSTKLSKGNFLYFYFFFLISLIFSSFCSKRCCQTGPSRCDGPAGRNCAERRFNRLIGGGKNDVVGQSQFAPE